MRKNSPKIDFRGQEELVKELRKLSTKYCSSVWDSEEAVASDGQADVMIQVYSRMVETIIGRVNRAPDKNFLAFLDLLGLNLLPPRPARTALTFTLAKGAKKSHAYVEPGSQIAAEKSPDDKPVVFETESGLTVISPVPVKAISVVGEEDRWRDHSPVFFDEENREVETLFKGKELITHRIYLGHNNLFSFEEPKNIKIEIDIADDMSGSVRSVKLRESLFSKKISPTFRFSGAVMAFKLDLYSMLNVSNKYSASFPSLRLGGTAPFDVKWYAWSEDSENPVELIVDEDAVGYDPQVVNLSKKGKGYITFKNVPLMPETTLTGYEPVGNESKSWVNRWIYAELVTPLVQENLPEIDSIKTIIETDSQDTLNVDLAFFNSFPIDLTKDFVPFGERPKFNDTFYIASKEVFSKTNAKVNLNFTFSEEIGHPDTGNITLLWEFWNGEKWDKLGKALIGGTTNESPYDFSDETHAFTSAVTDPLILDFTCPSISVSKVNGEENHWIRARIFKGNYGEEAKYKEFTESGEEIVYDDGEKKYEDSKGNWTTLSSDVKTNWTYVPATYIAPSLQSLAISYIPVAENFQEIVSCNNFHYQSLPTDNSFKPFTWMSDEESALYIAFEENISGLPVTLYFPLISGNYQPSLGGEDVPPRLSWQYWNGSEWASLMVEDHTKELTKREMISFLAPDDVKKRPCFNENLFWIRAFLVEGDFNSRPKLVGIYGNSVWVKNIISIKREILGSSNGEPGQLFVCSQSPILPGQKIMVRENSLTEKEKNSLIDKAGESALYEIKDNAENILETWILWQEVDHFYFSGSHDRHYIVDRMTGKIIFGNGIKGMIPQAGADNIQSEYRAGGGMRGNISNGEITKLRSNISYVDKVSNPVAAEGGTDQESFDGIRVRAPRTIRHRNRAVTFKDYEWIAMESSPTVARVKCLSVSNPLKQFMPGWVTVVIVPDSKENKPQPTEELLEEVKNYLVERTPGNLTSSDIEQITVIPPNYMGIRVEVDIAFKSISEAKITENRISESLNRFLHPLTGGSQGKGWEFGRNVYITEIYEMIEKVAGVDYVKDVKLDANLQIVNMSLESPFTVTYNFPAKSRLLFQGEKIVFLLAEKVRKNEEVSKLKVTGFKEGDFIEVYEYDDVEQTKIKSFTTRIVFLSGDSKNSLHFEEQNIDEVFPIGSIVETFLKPEGERVRSYLTKTLKSGDQSKIAVALPGKDSKNNDYILSHKDWPSNTVDGEFKGFINEIDTVYLEDDYLIYRDNREIEETATHDESEAEEKGISKKSTKNNEVQGRTNKRYIMNLHSGEVHDIKNITPLCNVDRIKKRYKRYSDSLSEIKVSLEEMDYDYCGWCFPKGMSKR